MCDQHIPDRRYFRWRVELPIGMPEFSSRDLDILPLYVSKSAELSPVVTIGPS